MADYTPSHQSVVVPVDDLAQEIRRVDGNHSLGAGALAEALLPFLSERLAAAPAAPQTAGVGEAWEKLPEMDRGFYDYLREIDVLDGYDQIVAWPDIIAALRQRDINTEAEIEASLRAPSSLAGGAMWRDPSEIPEAKKGEHAYRIVAVKRADGEKVVTFSAFYMNAVPLWFEDDNESRNVTGWHSDSEGDDGPTYSPLLMGGDVLMGWREFPQWEAALSPEAPVREALDAASALLAQVDDYARRNGWPDNAPRERLRAALIPRHEAPTSPAWRDEYNRVEAIREAAEGQDRIARSTADPIAKSDAETQAAGHWTRYDREVAKLNAASGHEAPVSKNDYAAPKTINEAPAEGAGRADVLATMRDHYQFALTGPWPDIKTPNYALAGLFKMAGDEIERLRARSSAPEAREGEAVAVEDEPWPDSPIANAIHALFQQDFCLDTEEASTATADVLKIIEAHPVAPSADKLRFNPTHRHWARGTTYEVIGEARLQQAGQFGPVEGDSITVYRGEDGQLWCRAQSEFEDGRFENLSTPDALKAEGA